MADFSKIIELSDDKLKSLHKNLHGDISDPAVLEAHHLVTTELTRREINHGHTDDEWAFAQIEVDSVSSVDLEDVTTEISDELAVEVAKKIGISGDVRIMLGVDGYEMQIEKSLEQDEEDLTKETFEKTIKRRGGKYVVLSEDGDREFGTYDTKREAEARLAQIERFKDMDKAEGHSPPESVREAAQRALDWISEGKAGQGFTSVGRGRARQLATGQSVSVDTLKRMRSFFARHIVDKKAEGFSRGEKGYPSPGKVAWDAWGGDAGRAWAESILDRVEKSDYPEMYDPDEGLNYRQQVLYATLENIVSEFGAFNEGDGADGAHYMDEENNPFAEDGLNCANCVFFQGGGGCEILNVEVAPMGVCKFWIIPEKLVVRKHEEHVQLTHGNWAGDGLSRELTTSILDRVRAGGGLSVNMVDGSEPKKGFMVAVKIKKPEDVSADDFYDVEKGAKILSDFVKSNKDNIATGKNYLGLWHNKENNRVYLDVSQNVQDRATAVRLGKQRNQISIWDVANFAEIETGGTGVIKRQRDSGNSVARESQGYDRRRNRGVGGKSLRPTNEINQNGNKEKAKHGIDKSESENQWSGDSDSRDLESDDQRREEGLGSQSSEQLEKHGTHTQSDHGNWAINRRRRAETMASGEIPDYSTDSAGRIVNPDATGGYKAGIPEKIVFNQQEFTPKDSLWHHLVPNGKGGYEISQERALLHSEIEAKLTGKVPVSTDPTFTMFGGGPASGKSTVLKSGKVDVPAKDKAVQINADDIKEMLPENPRMRNSKNDNDFFRAAEFVHEESSIITKNVQGRAVFEGKDIVLDGTGDSAINKLAKKVNQARDAGYKVNGVYVTIPTEEAWSRSTKRALGENKRFVPETVVRGTHRDVSQTFPLAIKAGLFDNSSLWENSGTSVKLVGTGTGKNFDVVDQAEYDLFLAKGDE